MPVTGEDDSLTHPFQEVYTEHEPFQEAPQKDSTVNVTLCAPLQKTDTSVPNVNLSLNKCPVLRRSFESEDLSFRKPAQKTAGGPISGPIEC